MKPRWLVFALTLPTEDVLFVQYTVPTIIMSRQCDQHSKARAVPRQNVNLNHCFAAGPSLQLFVNLASHPMSRQLLSTMPPASADPVTHTSLCSNRPHAACAGERAALMCLPVGTQALYILRGQQPYRKRARMEGERSGGPDPVLSAGVPCAGGPGSPPGMSGGGPPLRQTLSAPAPLMDPVEDALDGEWPLSGPFNFDRWRDMIERCARAPCLLQIRERVRNKAAKV